MLDFEFSLCQELCWIVFSHVPKLIDRQSSNIIYEICLMEGGIVYFSRIIGISFTNHTNLKCYISQTNCPTAMK